LAKDRWRDARRKSSARSGHAVQMGRANGAPLKSETVAAVLVRRNEQNIRFFHGASRREQVHSECIPCVPLILITPSYPPQR